jgi:hypothetical protein
MGSKQISTTHTTHMLYSKKITILNAFLLKEELKTNPDMPQRDCPHTIKQDPINENVFSVDLNGNGQCIDQYIVATMDQIGTMDGLHDVLYRDLTIDDTFVYKKKRYAIIPYPTI